MDRQPNWGAAAVEDGWRKGTWSAQEDKLLIEHVNLHGEGSWNSVSKQTGLKRSGKSCRLRWVNYLSPDLKRGKITPEEESIIIQLHALWGNRWSAIARSLPGRTDNEIKNYWRTHFKKRSSSKRVEKARAELLRQRQEQRKHEEERHQDVQQQQQEEDNSVGMIMNQVEQVAVARDMQQEMDCYMYPLSDMLQGGGAVGSIGDGSSSTAEGSCGSLWHLDDMLAEIEGAHGGGLQVQDQVLAFHSEELLWREHIM